MKRCVLDLEANGLLDTADKIWCAAAIDIETNEKWFWGPEEVSSLPKWLDDNCSEIIMHNGIGYDAPLMKKIWGYEFKGTFTDTVIMSRLFQPNRSVPLNCPNKRHPHSVEVWGYRVGRGKVEHNEWDKYTEEMGHRCREDVEIQLLIYKELMKEAEALGGWFDPPYYPTRMTHQLFKIIQQIGEYGWQFDEKHAKDCSERLYYIMLNIAEKITPLLPYKCICLEKAVKEVDENYKAPLLFINPSITFQGEWWSYTRKPFLKNGHLSANVSRYMEETGHVGKIVGSFSKVEFRRVNVESNDELKGLLLSLGWEPQEWNVDGEGERTSPKLSKDETFEGLKGGLGKLISKRIQCKHRKANIDGWLERVRWDGRLPSLISGLATTGRAKHSNIANVPGGETFFGKEMRKCFIARPGYSLVGVDSAGCQNRMLAARVGDPFFTKTLLEGRKEDKTTIHYVNQRAIKDVAGIDVSYHLCKSLNYGTLFGASSGKLGKMVGAGKDVGELIQKAIYGVAPGFQQLIDNLKEEWRRNAKRRTNKWGGIGWYNGWIRGLDGRPIFVESEHALLVYLLQSDEAIMMSTALCKLYKDATREFGPFGKRWGVVCFYHK